MAKISKHSISNKNISSRKETVFKIGLIIIPFIILLVFEGLLRLVEYGDDLSLFIQNPKKGYEEYLIVNPKIGKKYFQKFEYTAPANDIFLKNKPEDAYRIFVMGSSTVFGFPYDRNMMFSRILNKRLQENYNNKNIEIVNTAITAINSFTLRDYIDEILSHKPDAILIYAGHNEFYGAFGIGSNETMSRNPGLTRLHIGLMDYRIYQLMRNMISGITQKLVSNKKTKVHGTLMKRIVANKDIILNSEDYNLAMERYEQNMDHILKKLKKENVPVFFSEVVCNIKDLEPFNSRETDSLESAINVYKQAKIAESKNEYKTALKLYYKAKDLDCIRFRATEDVNNIIHKLVKDYDAYLVPMVSYFQNNSPNSLIGNNLMTEHVHPNINGNFLMAEAFFNEITATKIVGQETQHTLTTFDYFKKNWGYTVLDSLLAHHKVQQLKSYWPFVNDNNSGFDYTKTYKPKSHIDSIAFSILKHSDLKLNEVRLKLAKEYEAKGQFLKAYKEYESLLRTNPYLAVNYRVTASCLIKMADLPLALNYFIKSLEYEDSYFAYFKIGEIYLLQGFYNKAVEYFKKAYPLAPNKKRINILSKSYVALIYANRIEDAELIAKELKKIDSKLNFKIPQKKYIYTNYIPLQTRKQVNKAKILIAADKTDEALTILESSLKIYDSHIANRIIGEIYFQNKNYDKAILYFNKVYNQFQTDPIFLHNLTLLYVEKKDFVNAKKCRQELQLIDSKNIYLE